MINELENMLDDLGAADLDELEYETLGHLLIETDCDEPHEPLDCWESGW